MRRSEGFGAAVAIALALLCAWLLLPSLRAPDSNPAARDGAGETAPPPPIAGLRPALAGAAPTALPVVDRSADEPSPGDPSAGVSIVPTLALEDAGAQDEPELPKERVPLDVTVVDRYGAPVPGARIVAVWGEWRTAAVAADAQGKATLRVPRGTRALEVVGVDPPDPRPFLYIHYHALAGGESSTRVVVRLGSSIDGRLVGPDGAPIAGAIVRTEPEIYGFSAVRTDANGKFHLGALEGNRVDVRFDGMVAEPALDLGTVQNEEIKIHVSESAETRVGDLRALASAVLPGPDPLLLRAERVTRRADLEVVVLADGRPRPGAEVRTVSSGIREYDLGVETDREGRAVLRGLPAWPVTVGLKWIQPGTLAHGGPPSLEAILRAPMLVDAVPGGPPVTVRLTHIAALKGRVVDASGNPVAKAWCAALEGSQYAACFATDAEGRFESPSNVPPGTRLQVSARYPMDRPTSCGVIDGVVAGDGELRIVLEPVPGR